MIDKKSEVEYFWHAKNGTINFKNCIFVELNKLWWNNKIWMVGNKQALERRLEIDVCVLKNKSRGMRGTTILSCLDKPR